jgi:hypothetical protein
VGQALTLLAIVCAALGSLATLGGCQSVSRGAHHTVATSGQGADQQHVLEISQEGGDTLRVTFSAQAVAPYLAEVTGSVIDAAAAVVGRGVGAVRGIVDLFGGRRRGAAPSGGGGSAT